MAKSLLVKLSLNHYSINIPSIHSNLFASQIIETYIKNLKSKIFDLTNNNILFILSNS